MPANQPDTMFLADPQTAGIVDLVQRYRAAEATKGAALKASPFNHTNYEQACEERNLAAFLLADHVAYYSDLPTGEVRVYLTLPTDR